MRLFIDTLIALTLVIFFSFVLFHRLAEARQLERIQLTQQNISRIITTSLYHASLHDAERSVRGFPLNISQAWFDSLPRNMLAQDAPKWIDVSAPDSAGLTNPLTLIVDKHNAGFWYNPYRGILRARVPRQMTDSATIALYNAVNKTSLPTDVMVTSADQSHDWP